MDSMQCEHVDWWRMEGVRACGATQCMARLRHESPQPHAMCAAWGP